MAGDGEARGRLEQIMPANVTMVGAVSDADKLALLQLCTALVLPSHLRSEAFGVVLLEASRAGKPMISCELGTGTSYVNIGGVTGVVVPPADVGALAAAMQMLWHDPGAASALGKAARRRFEDLFKAETMCKQYADLYRVVARLPPRAPSRLRYAQAT
jgi:rhamnosyl/mannosyltransferase